MSVRKIGALTIEFDGGKSLTVDPDESYEARQISIPGTAMLVCQPGGAVSVFCESGGPSGKDKPKT